jgi:hypothetical protein
MVTRPQFVPVDHGATAQQWERVEWYDHVKGYGVTYYPIKQKPLRLDHVVNKRPRGALQPQQFVPGVFLDPMQEQEARRAEAMWWEIQQQECGVARPSGSVLDSAKK